MRYAKFAALGLLLIGILYLAGSLNRDKTIAPPSSTAMAPKSNPIRIGFSQAENNNPWRIAETNSMKEEAKKRNYDLIYTDAQSNTEKQLTDIEYILTQHIDYLILAPREYKRLGLALQMAKKARVPVILVDREAEGSSGNDYVTFISADHEWEGEEAARWLVQQIKGKGNIVEISATTGSSVQQSRTKGFKKVVSQYPGIHVIASQSGESARSIGQKVMESMIQKEGRQITAIFSQADESTIGAIQALKAAGYKPNEDVVIVSVDGEKDALKAIIAGELGATVECNPFLGPMAFDAIEKHKNGERVPPRIIQPGRIFDKKNANEYIDLAF
jgi:ABC-type sugar transport system substrate-binding protein